MESDTMIRVAVGCSPDNEDAESCAVLEYSLRKHASEEVAITWMRLSRDPQSLWYSNGTQGFQTQSWSTPFSSLRWTCPALFNFEGKCLYTDSDVIFMGDVAELWNQPFAPGKCVLAKGGSESWRFCVSLFDCARAKPHMMAPDELKRSGAHQEMIRRFRNASFVQPFSGNWNCIDGEGYESLIDPEIKLIHYSQENTQPHLRYAVPRLASEGRDHWFDGPMKRHWRPDLVALFAKTLAEAIAAGFRPENYAPAVPFGPYRIASHKAYRGHKWATAAA